MNEAETLLSVHLREKCIDHLCEIRIVPTRKWRWDFVVENLAIEIQGGIWMEKGAHNTGSAITRDCEKARAAIMAGYIPVNFTTAEVLDGTAINWLVEYRSKT